MVDKLLLRSFRPLDFEGAEVLASLAGVADPGAQAQVVPSRGP